MYFLNVNALASDLREDRVSPRDQMLYLAAWGLYQMTEVQNALFVWDQPSYFAIAKIGCLAVVIVGGIILSYRANGGAGGQRFVERFICISWPIRVWLTVLAWAPGLVALALQHGGVIRKRAFEAFVDPSGPAMVTLYLIIQIVFYLWVRSAIQSISEGKGTSPAEAP
ncbi:MAG: hypothetical protein AB1646_04265 [Thermodesulfobacteriota bacterium]